MSSTADPYRFVLASASPRRKRLLGSLGLTFEICPSDIDETARPGEMPENYVRRMAHEKALAVASELAEPALVLGADTIVVLENGVLGKPRDRNHAAKMLGQLSGRTHRVVTGFCVIVPGAEPLRQQITTEVSFKDLGALELEHYLDSGEWRDKAGAYAIQGGAAYMVRKISGSYTNVVGLPLCEAVEALRTAWRMRPT